MSLEAVAASAGSSRSAHTPGVDRQNAGRAAHRAVAGPAGQGLHRQAGQGFHRPEQPLRPRGPGKLEAIHTGDAARRMAQMVEGIAPADEHGDLPRDRRERPVRRPPQGQGERPTRPTWPASRTRPEARSIRRPLTPPRPAKLARRSPKPGAARQMMTIEPAYPAFEQAYQAGRAAARLDPADRRPRDPAFGLSQDRARPAVRLPVRVASRATPSAPVIRSSRQLPTSSGAAGATRPRSRKGADIAAAPLHVPGGRRAGQPARPGGRLAHRTPGQPAAAVGGPVRRHRLRQDTPGGAAAGHQPGHTGPAGRGDDAAPP